MLISVVLSIFKICPMLLQNIISNLFYFRKVFLNYNFQYLFSSLGIFSLETSVLYTLDLLYLHYLSHSLEYFECLIFLWCLKISSFSSSISHKELYIDFIQYVVLIVYSSLLKWYFSFISLSKSYHLISEFVEFWFILFFYAFYNFLPLSSKWNKVFIPYNPFI